MKIIFTDHARRRARERALSLAVVRTYIRNPDAAEPSRKDPRRFLIKKIYYHHTFRTRHILMAICEHEGNALVVVTLIDTSKVKKYS